MTGALAAAVVAALAFLVDEDAGAAGGFFVATALAAGFAAHLLVSERRRHVVAEDELHAQAAFLESLVASLKAVSSSLEQSEILERTCAEAKRLFGARNVRFHEGETPSEPDERSGKERMAVPICVLGERIGVLELERARPFQRSETVAARILGEFTSRAVESARLLAQAGEREAERARLTDRLITAEQDERRRLSLFLHDGALQSLSGIALMHDAALSALQEGRVADAARVIEGALERERDTIRSLRDLSFAIEPVVLRDQGFAAAVHALRDQVEESHRLGISADVEAGDRLSEKAGAALYQIVREAIAQALQRSPSRIEVGVTESEEGGFVAEISDDGVGERRRAGVRALEERVRVLNGRLAVDRTGAGTTVTVLLPQHVGAVESGVEG